MDTDQWPPSGATGQAARGILRYALAHPDAKDAVKGIHRWWLPQGGDGWGEEEVEEALSSLVKQGWMTATRIAGRTIYGVAKERLEEMGRWLQEDGEKGRDG